MPSIFLLSVLLFLPLSDSMIITSVYAGRKKFKTYSFDKFLPPIIIEKPHKLAFSFHGHKRLSSPAFKLKFNIPLNLPIHLNYAHSYQNDGWKDDLIDGWNNPQASPDTTYDNTDEPMDHSLSSDDTIPVKTHEEYDHDNDHEHDNDDNQHHQLFTTEDVNYPSSYSNDQSIGKYTHQELDNYNSNPSVHGTSFSGNTGLNEIPDLSPDSMGNYPRFPGIHGGLPGFSSLIDSPYEYPSNDKPSYSTTPGIFKSISNLFRTRRPYTGKAQVSSFIDNGNFVSAQQPIEDMETFNSPSNTNYNPSIDTFNQNSGPFAFISNSLRKAKEQIKRITPQKLLGIKLSSQTNDPWLNQNNLIQPHIVPVYPKITEEPTHSYFHQPFQHDILLQTTNDEDTEIKTKDNKFKQALEYETNSEHFKNHFTSLKENSLSDTKHADDRNFDHQHSESQPSKNKETSIDQEKDGLVTSTVNDSTNTSGSALESILISNQTNVLVPLTNHTQENIEDDKDSSKTETIEDKKNFTDKNDDENYDEKESKDQSQRRSLYIYEQPNTNFSHNENANYQVHPPKEFYSQSINRPIYLPLPESIPIDRRSKIPYKLKLAKLGAIKAGGALGKMRKKGMVLYLKFADLKNIKTVRLGYQDLPPTHSLLLAHAATPDSIPLFLHPSQWGKYYQSLTFTNGIKGIPFQPRGLGKLIFFKKFK